MALVPFAALSLEAVTSNFTAQKISKLWTRFQDSINFGEILPPIGSQQLSYAKFLQLLSHRKIKRIILMDNATCAIVEVCSLSLLSFPGPCLLTHQSKLGRCTKTAGHQANFLS